MRRNTSGNKQHIDLQQAQGAAAAADADAAATTAAIAAGFF